MAITTAMCTSFKSELMGGTHDLDTDVLKLALIKDTPTGTYDATTTNLDGAVIATSGTTAYLDFTDEVFADVTVSADGCIIYNSSKANRAIAVIDFGGTVAATAGDLTIEFPTADASNAIIRIA
jgi:hypothetical protein